MLNDTYGKYTPKTGDEVSGSVLAVLALGSCLALGFALHALRHSRKKNMDGPLINNEQNSDDSSYWRNLYEGK